MNYADLNDNELIYYINEHDDEANNIICYRYYGTNNEPIMLSSGYAEMRRVYNEKKQIIEESYYDTE